MLNACCIVCAGIVCYSFNCACAMGNSADIMRQTHNANTKKSKISAVNAILQKISCTITKVKELNILIVVFIYLPVAIKIIIRLHLLGSQFENIEK